jgi:hypothetical protein
MIRSSRAHLSANGETYVEHLRFAATVGVLAIGAGAACLIHAVIPALCTSTASRTIRQIHTLLEARERLVEVRDQAAELIAFVLLLALAAAVVAPLWLLPVAASISLAFTALAFSIPLTLLLVSRELDGHASE